MFIEGGSLFGPPSFLLFPALMKRLSYLLFLLLFITYFLCFQGVLSHIIYYHEQHELFLYTKEYFFQQIGSKGWLSYLTCFIIQFFYIPVLGNALLAGMLAGIYLLTRYNVQRITGQSDKFQLSLLPSLYLFIHTMSASNSLTPVTGTFLGLLLLSCINCLTVKPWKYVYRIPYFTIRGKKTNILLFILIILLYTGGVFYAFVHSYNRNERIMLMAEKSVKEKRWNDVLAQTGKYMDSGRSNQLISYFHNLALYHTGKLPYHLFDYPQTAGVKALYFPWNSDSRESEYGHFLYEDLGYINEAQRWEFEAMVVWGETAPHLLNLARYNIANDRPKVARRFINLLKQSLFYKTEAEQLEQLSPAAEVPGLRNSLPLNNEAPVRFANIVNIGPELQYLCEQDSTNQMAFEYLMGYLLLSNDVVRFADNLKFIRHFSYQKMPPVYEEALYIYKLGVGDEAFAQKGFSISEQTEKRFRQYYSLYKNKEMQKLQAEFGNTYWYYLNFISPYGDKIIKH